MKYIFIISFFTLLLNGCDIFDTREAEKPVQPRSNYQPAFNPADVINNLINSLKDKDVENYLQCFSDSSNSGKLFSFDPSGSIQQISDNWNKKNEEQYFNNLKNKISADKQITLVFNNPTFSSPQGDSIIFTSGYSINVPHNETNLSENFQGNLRFSLIRNSLSIWSIYYWQDIKSSSQPSWSDLKGWFY